jgi:chromosome segregation protein
LLKEFAKIAQFVVITHNKNTMAAASIMYGVTMQERGVSRIVSVKFNEHKPQTLQTPIPVEPSLAVPAAV